MLPTVKRTLSSAFTKLEKVKKVVVGLAVAAVVATGGMTAPGDAQAASSVQVTASTPVMLLATPAGERVAWHSSHASHSSHESHASHASHYSSR